MLALLSSVVSFLHVIVKTLHGASTKSAAEANSAIFTQPIKAQVVQPVEGLHASHSLFAILCGSACLVDKPVTVATVAFPVWFHFGASDFKQASAKGRSECALPVQLLPSSPVRQNRCLLLRRPLSDCLASQTNSCIMQCCLSHATCLGAKSSWLLISCSPLCPSIPFLLPLLLSHFSLY